MKSKTAEQAKSRKLQRLVKRLANSLAVEVQIRHYMQAHPETFERCGLLHCAKVRDLLQEAREP